MIYRARSASLAAVALGSFQATATFAQSADETTTTRVEEVVVTAQRREQSLQDVPLAITAFGAEMLERTAATGIEDVASRTPGVTMTQFNVGEPQVYIRGVGSTSDSAAADPSIGISIDDVSLGRAGASALAFLDIERVEVLRGPQGTLYGRNASGGAINIFSKVPTSTPLAEITLRVGSFDERGGEAIVNGPLGDEINGRLAMRYSTSNGYAKSVASGERLHGGTSYGGRAQLASTLGEWQARLSLDYSKDDLDGQARIAMTGPSTPAPVAALVSQLRAGLDEREALTSQHLYQDRDNWGVVARLEREWQPVTLTSVSAYRHNDYRWRDDLGGMPAPPHPLSVDDLAAEKSSQASQELRLTSNTESTLSWVAGVYYFREQVERLERFVAVTVPPLLPPALTGDVSFLQDATSTSYAAFGQATLPFASIWELTAGARWTRDEREIAQAAKNNDPTDVTPGLPLFPGSPYAASADTSFSEPSWRLALSVEPFRDKRIYVSYDRGYKGGAYPSQAQSALQATTAIKAEMLDNYDIGFKTRWFDNLLQVNGDYFRLDYQDLQVFELQNGLTLVSSNADAKVDGFELEAEVAITSGIAVGGTYSRLSSEYETNPTAGTITLLYKGNELPRTPNSQYGAYVEGEFSLAGGTLVARADYQWTDDFYFNPSNNRASLVDAYGTVGAFLSWESASGLKLAAYGRNLTDEIYPLHMTTTLEASYQVLATPRSFGLSITRAFE